MKLLCDLGNTRMKWALWDGGFSGFGTVAYGGADDFATLLGALPRPAVVAAISVAAIRNPVLSAFCAHHWQLVPTWYTACRAAGGIRSLYEPPETLGADRFAALVGARARFGATALCVVDCGTAITVDALDYAGVFRGGAILPGIPTAAEALVRIADTLSVADWTGTAQALGTSTASAVKAGVLIGAAGAINRLLEEQKTVLGDIVLVVLTGGDALRIAPYLACRYEIVPHLTLEGLAVMAA
ncbi:MAG: type III pantothenate kinase [Acidiferrobacter sp.]